MNESRLKWFFLLLAVLENLRLVFSAGEYGYSAPAGPPNPHVTLEMSGKAPNGYYFQLKSGGAVLVGPKDVFRGRWRFTHELKIGTGQKYVLVFQKKNDDKIKHEIDIIFGSNKLAEDKGVKITFWGTHMVDANIQPIKDSDVCLENRNKDTKPAANIDADGKWTLKQKTEQGGGKKYVIALNKTYYKSSEIEISQVQEWFNQIIKEMEDKSKQAEEMQKVNIRTWDSANYLGRWAIDRHISPKNEYFLSIANDEISDITIKLY